MEVKSYDAVLGDVEVTAAAGERIWMDPSQVLELSNCHNFAKAVSASRIRRLLVMCCSCCRVVQYKTSSTAHPTRAAPASVPLTPST